MTTSTEKRLIEIVDRLSPELQREVLDFAGYLATRQEKGKRNDLGKPARITGEGWYGALSHLKDRYRSGVELQHETLKEWEKFD